MKEISLKRLSDMNANDIVEDYQGIEMKYYDGNKRNVLYTPKETLFPEGEKIASVSDLEGNILTANSTFAHMSGYSRRELVGMPHHVLRHPDMPKSAFQEMWQSLANNGEWKGYVKNLRKDGGFYWVFASIFSLTRHGEVVGYTSIRSEAPREKIASHTALYQQMLAKEK